MNMVEIREVTTKNQLRQFVDFPNRMYKDVPQFIPSMYSDDLQDWDRRKNPAFEYCEGKCFLAYKNGALVGRIAAVLSKKSNEKWNQRRMRFWQVDFIDDPEVSDALFKAVEDYAREKGCNEVHGPLGFTDLDSEGMLVEGFEEKGMFITFYNYPYYKDHLERLGYRKDVDWIEYLLDLTYDEQANARWDKLAARVMERSHLRILNITSRKQYGPLLESVFDLANTAYSQLYSTVPISRAQIKRYADKFVPIIDPDLTCFVVNEHDQLVGFGISAPSMADALKKSRGRLFPLGWIGVLRALKRNDTLDLFLIAVADEYRNKGVNAVIISHILKGCHKMGITKAETGPQLENNEKILHQWSQFKFRQHKRRRCFIKQLD